ncbi:hypothetical protein HYS28_02355 [Candidatus Uhrbacteria bacterium]|nr:hypothetical protein [Candidatus Uhrbacteria bacterium]
MPIDPLDQRWTTPVRTTLVLAGGARTCTCIGLTDKPLAFIEVDSPDGKGGYPLIVDWRMTKAAFARGDHHMVFAGYDNVYGAERAQNGHATTWVAHQLKVHGDCRELFAGSLLEAYGRPIDDAERFYALQEEYARVFADGVDPKDYPVHNADFARSVALIRTARGVKGSRKYPGTASALRRMTRQLVALHEDKERVVPLGAVLASYIEAVLSRIIRHRAAIEQLMALEPKKLLTPNRPDRLKELREALKEILVARPFRRSRDMIVEELDQVTELVIYALHNPSDEVRTHVVNLSRSILGTVRDALLLRERQYEIERILKRVAVWERWDQRPTEAQWLRLHREIDDVLDRTGAGLGHGFRRNRVHEIRAYLEEARSVSRTVRQFEPEPSRQLAAIGAKLRAVSKLI